MPITVSGLSAVKNFSRDWKIIYEKIRKYDFVLPMSFVIFVGVLTV